MAKTAHTKSHPLSRSCVCHNKYRCVYTAGKKRGTCCSPSDWQDCRWFYLTRCASSLPVVCHSLITVSPPTLPLHYPFYFALGNLLHGCLFPHLLGCPFLLRRVCICWRVCMRLLLRTSSVSARVFVSDCVRVCAFVQAFASRASGEMVDLIPT